MRMIDADALRKFIEEKFKDGVPFEWAWTLTAVDNAPTVDAVEVVHGRWVNAAGGRTICNHCGEYPLYDYFGRQKFSNSCPNCGARMDGERRSGDERA